MWSVDKLFEGFQPPDNDGLYMPDDGICAVCDKLARNHSGVERLLAARGLKYSDPDSGRTILRAAIPYCRCPQSGL